MTLNPYDSDPYYEEPPDPYDPENEEGFWENVDRQIEDAKEKEW